MHDRHYKNERALNEWVLDTMSAMAGLLLPRMLRLGDMGR